VNGDNRITWGRGSTGGVTGDQEENVFCGQEKYSDECSGDTSCGRRSGVLLQEGIAALSGIGPESIF